ncbi:P-loop containing nucleoside triphosphate hydrolase protein [Acrodontium crateriforme]|uniref:P-loop containing nucleoside triphosphate hydrolase protein n=1 Tax=Acrodontium crateriforme TaxID=150365 RepID=A0AAQ3M6L3_9PEZI|nr:P-loop containing nucleoside triphosphate hydrolase protein [Acrodontium crateriforme]
MAKSFFDAMWRDSELSEKAQLEVQHRMKAAHSDLVSQVFYNGTLKNHPSLAIQTPLDVTLNHALRQGLGKHWAGHLRIAVAVSGANVFSQTYGVSKSSVNYAEANLLVDHIAWLVDNEGKRTIPEGGRKITYDDILVISPYTGQVAYINQLIWHMKLFNETSRPKVLTSNTVQGDEAPIVLLSMVRNTPNKPLKLGFVGQKKQLCVNFSRVKNYQITFGNWLPWAMADCNENSKKIFNKVNDFRKIVNHHRLKKDIVSAAHLEAMHRNMASTELRDIDGFAFQLAHPKSNRQYSRVDKRGRAAEITWVSGSTAPSQPVVPIRSANNVFFARAKKPRTAGPEPTDENMED